MGVSKASLSRSVAATEQRWATVWQRVEEDERPEDPTPPQWRSAVDLAAEVGVSLDTWQREALTTKVHDLLLLVTRQGGKGEVATFLALEQAVNVPGSTTVIVSRAERQAKRLLRRIKRKFRQLASVPKIITDNQYEIGLQNGAEILALPGSEETIRGIDAVHLLIIDEAALVSEDLFNGVYPMLASTDGRCVAMSSARGARGWFWREYVGTDPDWHRTKITWKDIPRFKPGWIERTRRRMGELMFAQEFECEFLGDGAVFRKINEAAIAEPQTSRIEGHDYLISVDWGKLTDWTVLAVLDLTLGEIVALDRFQKIDYELQMGRLQGLCERFRPVALAPERNSMGEPLIEDLARAEWCPPAILPFYTTNASKAVAVEMFALALEVGAVRFIPEPVLTTELHAFAGTRLPSGLIRYGAPKGGHDDCVMAAIIGWFAAMGGMEDETETVVHDDPVSISVV
jgi:hypothetical protein